MTITLHKPQEETVAYVRSAVLFWTASCRIWKMVNLLSWPPLAFRALRKGWQPFKRPRALCRQSAAQREDVSSHYMSGMLWVSPDDSSGRAMPQQQLRSDNARYIAPPRLCCTAGQASDNLDDSLSTELQDCTTYRNARMRGKLRVLGTKAYVLVEL